MNRRSITAAIVGALVGGSFMALGAFYANHKGQTGNVDSNVPASFNEEIDYPEIHQAAYVHPRASVIGNVTLGREVFVAPFASIRGDEGQPIFIGDESNVQDGVVLHALETEEHGKPIEKNLVEVSGRKYAVHVGERVSLAHQSQVHGPARVGDDTFVGMQALVFKAEVGRRCVIEPGAKVLGGVKIADGRYVPAGTVVSTQAQADKLPAITDDYPLKNLNKGVLHVNTQLAAGYQGGGAAAHGEGKATKESTNRHDRKNQERK